MSHKCAFFKQKQLGSKLMASQQKIEERIKKWQDLRQAVASLKVRNLENDWEGISVNIYYVS